MSKSRNSILVLNDCRQTVTVVRSLAQAGYRVIVGKTNRKEKLAEYSRYTSEEWIHPPIRSDIREFIDALVQLLSRRPDIRFVFPISEFHIKCLAQHEGSLPSTVEFVMAEASVIDKCLDKGYVYEMVEGSGVPYPGHWKAFDYDALLKTVSNIGYPCIVKPNDSHSPFFNRKAIILKSSEDLRRYLPEWPEGNTFLVLQKYVTGYRHNCHFLADKGHLLSYFEQRVLRTDRIDGTGYGVDGVSFAPDRKLMKYCESILLRLEYSGVGCVQFLVNDRTGMASCLGINPRLDATCAIPFHLGYDFPLMAVEYIEYRLGDRPLPPRQFSPYMAGKHGVWLIGDIKGLVFEWRSGNLDLPGLCRWVTRMVNSVFSADLHLTWSWRDPIPALAAFYRLAKSILIGLVRQISRSFRRLLHLPEPITDLHRTLLR